MDNGLFFFQAEDGIRDAQESRGLGDVYKRQTLASIGIGALETKAGRTAERMTLPFTGLSFPQVAVSYTHLTLPTIYSV